MRNTLENKKAEVKFKTYDVTDQTTNNYIANIAQYLGKDNREMKFHQVMKYHMRNNFFSKIKEMIRQEDQFQTSLFFQTAFYKVKASDQHLDLDLQRKQTL